MLTAGPRARYGLLSPGDRTIERGDPFTVAFGIWGALNCRAGFVVEDASELPDGVDRLRRTSRRTVFQGRRRMVRGAPDRAGGRGAASDHRPPPRRRLLRDLPQPGTPAAPRRVGRTRPCFPTRPSSCDRAWRCSATSSPRPAPRTSRRTSKTAWRWPTNHCDLRSPIGIPDAWARVQARRRFMIETLGIDLHPDVLPFSNLAAHLSPLLLRTDRAMSLGADADTHRWSACPVEVA